MEDHVLSHDNRNDGVSAALFFPPFLFPQVLVYSIFAAHSFSETRTGTADKLNLLIVDSSIVHPQQGLALWSWMAMEMSFHIPVLNLLSRVSCTPQHL